MAKIKNGNRFPTAVKQAALEQYTSSTKSVKQIAASFNIGYSTLQVWAREANLSRPRGRIAAVQTAPVVVASVLPDAPVAMYAKASTTIVGIMYEGKLFT